MDQLAGTPFWAVHFTEGGECTAPDVATWKRELGSSGVRDLFILSHGWGTSERSARDLYDDLLPMIAEAAKDTPGLGPVGVAGIFWPALWFPDRPGDRDAPGGDAQSSTGGAAPLRSGDDAWSGSQIASALAPAFAADPDRAGTVQRLGDLIDEGERAVASGTESEESQRDRLREFHTLLQSVLPPLDTTSVEDSGETVLLRARDPETAYVAAAVEFGTAPEDVGAQGVGDIFRTVWNGAKSALRVASYWTMKSRAGQIGRTGLGPLLAELHRDDPDLRVHLIGHSFGARLVSFSLAGIPSPEDSPVHSLTLIQGAFSHFAFSHPADNPFSADGALRRYADRVHGPLVATWSPHDRAVGTWYPAASALARDDAAGTEALSQWGAVGGGGFRAVSPLATKKIADAGVDYGFTPGTFYSLDATRVIKAVEQSAFSGAHSDIRHPEVAWLVASAAGASATS